jgi:hypothetical protein
MGFLSAIPGWIKLAAVAIVLGVIITCIYQWRADIKQTAYDAIFKETVEAAMEANKKDFARQIDAEKAKREALEQQFENQRQIASDLERFRKSFLSQNFANKPIDPGLKYVFDQIRAEEEARRAAAEKAKSDTAGKAKESTR